MRSRSRSPVRHLCYLLPTYILVQETNNGTSVDDCCIDTENQCFNYGDVLKAKHSGVSPPVTYWLSEVSLLLPLSASPDR